MIQKFIPFFNICILFFVFLLPVSGQFEDVENARIQAKKLQESVLIVRLPVYAPKIRYLKNKLKEGTDEKVIRKMTEELVAVELANQARFKAIQFSLKEKYTFSPFLILPDSNYINFLSGQRGVFYNENGQIDDKIQWNSKDYFLLISGENEDQWVIVNSELRRIDSPFPYRARVFLSGLTRVFERNKYYEKQVRWFNKKLSVL